MKRTIPILGILLASGFAALPASAFDFEAGGLCYDILPGDQNQVKVTYRVLSSENSSYVTGDIVIPATVENDGKTYDVVAIGERAFQACGSLNSVEIPESVTSIGNRAFLDCATLTKADLPANLTVIEEGTFFNCYELTQVSDLE